jgi:hypothetical protein
MIVPQGKESRLAVYVTEYLEKQIGHKFYVFEQKFRYSISNFGTVRREEE